MGEVAVSIKIMMELEADTGMIKAKIRELGADSIEERPVGFGIRMLEAVFIFDDRQGANTDALEEKIRGIEGVTGVETGEAALI
jgi:translation elongation factor EF-1beta